MTYLIFIFICRLGSVAAVAAGGVALVGGGIAGERLVIIINHNHPLHSRGFQVLPESEWGEQRHVKGGEREEAGGTEEGENCSFSLQ